MNHAMLLIIEGKHSEYPEFSHQMRKKGFSVDSVSNGNEAIRKITSGSNPDVVIVNAASMRTSGKRICQNLHEARNGIPVVLILDSDHEVEKTEAEIVLTMPFTAQKLANRVRHLLPGDDKRSLHAGPIHLDMEKRTIRSHGKHACYTLLTY